MVGIVKTEVKINDTAIGTKLLKWQTVETFGDEIRECTILVTKSIYNLIIGLRPGMTVTIKRGFTTSTDEFVFSGTIDTIDKNGPYITLNCRDEMVKLINATVTYSYDGADHPATEAKGSDIATDLIETYGGMTADVVDTGTILTLKKFICNGTDVFSRLQILADIYDYQIYYDPTTDKVVFEPKGNQDNTNIVYVGGTNSNVTGIPKWSFDNTQCVNKLIVKGAVQEVQDDEFFNGTGGASQEFTLSKKPIATQVWDGSTLKVPGVDDSTSGTYDYTVDKENKKIIPTSNWTPSSGTANIKVTYTNAIPVPVQVEDLNSQVKYGVIVGEKMFSDIQTVDDAESRGNGWLEQFAEPFVQTTIKPVNFLDFEAGQKIQIIDDINEENRVVVINSIKRQYPYSPDEVKVGDKIWRLSDWGTFTIERIRRLEEENQKNTDLLVVVKSFSRTIPIYACASRQSRNIGHAFSPGHPVNSKVPDGTNVGVDSSPLTIGDQALGAYGEEFIIWNNNIFFDNFNDDFFIDSLTSASVSGGKIVFLSNGIAESTLIQNTGNDVVSMRLTAEAETSIANFKFYITGDFDTPVWQEVTSGTLETVGVSASGAKAAYKIVNQGSADNILKIKIEMEE